MSKIPETLINFRIYGDGTDMLGTADLTLPKMDAMTDTVKGAGIAGEVEVPVRGNFKSSELQAKWRTIDPNAAKLFTQTSHDIDCRGAFQVQDPGTGALDVQAVKLFCRVMPKGFELGKFEVAKMTDTTTSFEVLYLKLTINGKVVMELDKLNSVCKIGDTDLMADVREALGLS